MEDNNETSLHSLAGKYLTFHLSGEYYGLEIIKVQEIIKMMEVTRVPRTPEFVRGVINLRGKVIPVIDLRLKFEIEHQEDTDKTCVIVVQVKNNDETITIIGIIVDEVSEVMDIEADQIEPSPSFGANIDTNFILGMGKVGKKVLSMLDIDQILSSEEIASMEKIS